MPSGLQARKSATRRAPKLLVSNCQSSAEKLPDFSAEVGEVLLCVFLTSHKVFIFLCFLFVIHNYFVNLQRERLLNSLGGGTFVPYRKQTKRYALLLQVENLGNFHHCIEFPRRPVIMALKKMKTDMTASRVSVELLLLSYLFRAFSGPST